MRSPCRACGQAQTIASLEAGLLIVDKPRGPTSHDVVARVRRLSGQRRVGHAGTLDPMAEGVLVLGLGRATRLLEYVQEQPKSYTAWVRFGVTTDTLDAEGQVTSTAAVPSLEKDLPRLLGDFTGVIEQVPPRYSALKRAGQPLYARARRGEAPELEAREVVIYDLRLVSWEAPVAVLELSCGKGTYVRALARDLGEAVGCGAHLSGLLRTRVGRFQRSQAIPLQELGSRAWSEILHPPDEAVLHWPGVRLSAQQAAMLAGGRPVPAGAAAEGTHGRLYDPHLGLVAVGQVRQGQWRAIKAFPN